MAVAPFALLRRRRPVRRRSPGTFVAGEYQPGADVAADVPLGIQPPGVTAQADSQSLPEGDRTREMMAAFSSLDDALTPAGRDGHPGDLVWYDGSWWQVAAAFRNDALIGTPVAHVRHLMVRLAPGEDEGVPPAPAVSPVPTPSPF